MSPIGRKRGKPSRKRRIRADDPAIRWDWSKASKRDRMARSPDSYLRPTKERLKRLEEQDEEEE